MPANNVVTAFSFASSSCVQAAKRASDGRRNIFNNLFTFIFKSYFSVISPPSFVSSLPP